MEWLPPLLAAAGALVVAAIVVWRRRRAPLSASRPPSAPGLAARIRRAAGGEEAWQQIEEILLSADVGAAAAAEIVDRAKASVRQGGVPSAEEAVADEMVAMFGERDRALSLGSTPVVVVVVGVNGSGKTTTIGKLASMLRQSGMEPLLAAADTYRAAAVDQLREWGAALGVDVVGGEEGGDPAAVAFDALSAARSRGKDAVIIDTAGRLHSNTNLMGELAKVVRVLEREAGRVDDVLLVIDGTTGGNALAQARVFTEAVGVTGIVVTKLDGTAKGGIVLSVERQVGIPVKFVGVGEGAGDLLHFDPRWFVDHLLEGS